LFLALVYVVSPFAFAQQASEAASDGEIQNKHVGVTRYTILPNDSVTLPNFPNESIVVCLRGEELQRIGEKQTDTFCGESALAVWNRQGKQYRLENTSAAPAEILVLELKDSNSIGQVSFPVSERDPVSLDPRYFRIALQNEHVRVLRLHLPPRTGTLEEQFMNRLEISLSGSHLQWTDPLGKSSEERHRAGAAEWKYMRLMTIANLEEEPLDEILVEFKHPLCYPQPNQGYTAPPGTPPDEEAYLKKVHDIGSRHWFKRLPHGVHEGDRGAISLQFKLTPEGTIREDEITPLAVLGDVSLLEGAIEAVRQSGPFPPFPQSIQKPELVVKVGFIFFLPSKPLGCSN
jgi:hypothetical protein